MRFGLRSQTSSGVRPPQALCGRWGVVPGPEIGGEAIDLAKGRDQPDQAAHSLLEGLEDPLDSSRSSMGERGA